MDRKIDSRFINRFITSFIIDKEKYINVRYMKKDVEVFYYEKIYIFFNKFFYNE